MEIGLGREIVDSFMTDMLPGGFPLTSCLEPNIRVIGNLDLLCDKGTAWELVAFIVVPNEDTEDKAKCLFVANRASKGGARDAQSGGNWVFKHDGATAGPITLG